MHKKIKLRKTYCCAKCRLVQSGLPAVLLLTYSYVHVHVCNFNYVRNIHHRVPCSWWSEGEGWRNLCQGRFPETHKETYNHTLIRSERLVPLLLLTVQYDFTISAPSFERSQCLIARYRIRWVILMVYYSLSLRTQTRRVIAVMAEFSCLRIFT